MSLNRKLSFLGIIGLLIVILSDGFLFTIENSVTSVALDPLAIFAWPMFLISLICSIRSPKEKTDLAAPWWRCSAAFIIDFCLIVSFLAIPYCLLVLFIENGGLPIAWEIERKFVKPTDTFYTLFFIPIFVAIWEGIGFALHPKITTPGALIANIDFTTDGHIPRWRLAIFGVFAYYGVFIPIFGWFAPGIRVKRLRRVA